MEHDVHALRTRPVVQPPEEVMQLLRMAPPTMECGVRGHEGGLQRHHGRGLQDGSRRAGHEQTILLDDVAVENKAHVVLHIALAPA